MPDDRELERRLTRLETIQRGERERVERLENDVTALRQAAADLLTAVEVDRATRKTELEAERAWRLEESKRDRRLTGLIGGVIAAIVVAFEIARGLGVF